MTIVANSGDPPPGGGCCRLGSSCSSFCEELVKVREMRAIYIQGLVKEGQSAELMRETGV